MRFIVSGKSMEPTYYDGDKLFVTQKLFGIGVGSVVVLEDPRDKKMILKRIVDVSNGEFFVKGDNPVFSTDSGDFGRVSKNAIIGKVIFRYGREKRV